MAVARNFPDKMSSGICDMRGRE